MAAKPVVDGLEKELGKRVRFVRVDISTPNGRKIAARVGLDTVPTFIGFDAKGNEMWRTQRATRADLGRKVALL